MKKRALVVDDTKLFADTASGLLTDFGYEVTTVYDPRSAVEMIQQGRFDVVLTDKEMHNDREAGFEVALAARKSGDMPIVMMSGGVSAATLPLVQKRLGEIGGNTHFVDKTDIDWPDKVQAIFEGRQKPPSLATARP